MTELAELRVEHATLTAHAAELERAGAPVPAELRALLDDMQTEIRTRAAREPS